MSKCCQKCAYRHGSPERCDPWQWLFLQEDRDENQSPFYCHESVPGHSQEVEDDRPRWRLCAGYIATRGIPFKSLMRRTMIDREPDALVGRAPE